MLGDKEEMRLIVLCLVVFCLLAPDLDCSGRLEHSTKLRRRCISIIRFSGSAKN